MAQAGDEVLQQSFAMGPRPLGLQGWDRPPGARAGGGQPSALPPVASPRTANGDRLAVAAAAVLQCCPQHLDKPQRPSMDPLRNNHTQLGALPAARISASALPMRRPSPPTSSSPARS